jgi:hypothetical protein
MSKANPFAQTMVRMQLPPGMGASVSARGFNVEADDERCVTVPKDVGEELKAHGLVPYVEPEKAPAKK